MQLPVLGVCCLRPLALLQLCTILCPSAVICAGSGEHGGDIRRLVNTSVMAFAPALSTICRSSMLVCKSSKTKTRKRGDELAICGAEPAGAEAGALSVGTTVLVFWTVWFSTVNEEMARGLPLSKT